MTANQKGVGGGLQENKLNVQKHNFRKQTISALPCPLSHWCHTVTSIECKMNFREV